MGLWCTQMGAGGWISMIVVWAVVVGLVLWAVGRLFPAQVPRDPRALLDARLASGEITPEEYRSVRDELDGHTPAGAKGVR